MPYPSNDEKFSDPLPKSEAMALQAEWLKHPDFIVGDTTRIPGDAEMYTVRAVFRTHKPTAPEVILPPGFKGFSKSAVRKLSRLSRDWREVSRHFIDSPGWLQLEDIGMVEYEFVDGNDRVVRVRATPDTTDQRAEGFHWANQVWHEGSVPKVRDETASDIRTLQYLAGWNEYARGAEREHALARHFDFDGKMVDYGCWFLGAQIAITAICLALGGNIAWSWAPGVVGVGALVALLPLRRPASRAEEAALLHRLDQLYDNLGD